MTVDVTARADVDPAVWDAFVEENPNGWWWHTSRWLDYSLAYAPGAVDRSFAVLADGAMRAAVPLIDDGGEFTMGGAPCPDPLVYGPTHEDMRIVVDLVDLMLTRYAAGRVVTFRGQPRPVATGSPVAGPLWEDVSWQTNVLDLTTRNLWAPIRKSYKSLINHARKDRAVVTDWRGDDAAAMEEARRLHLRAAGRETRARATWAMMADWCRDGFGRLALVSSVDARPGTWRWDGYAFAIAWKDHAYYASGATITPSLAHVLQWALIGVLAQMPGVTRYELGWCEKPGDTDKDRQIAFFKSGFGGHRWTVPAITRRFQ